MASKPIHIENHLCPCYQLSDYKDRDVSRNVVYSPSENLTRLGA